MLSAFLKRLLYFESFPMVSTLESLARGHESEVLELESHTDKSAVKMSKAFDIIDCDSDAGRSARRASDTLADTFKVVAFLVLLLSSEAPLPMGLRIKSKAFRNNQSRFRCQSLPVLPI